MTQAQLARFWPKVGIDFETGCWPWLGATSDYGHGRFLLEARRGIRVERRAHTVAYEHFVGPIPEGLEPDHLCRNPACVNPAHLEPVTHRENMLRGETITARNAARTECPHGHPYDERNTYRYRGARYCRTCARDAMRRRRRLRVGVA